MSGLALFFSGRGVLVVGVEPDPGGLACRVYVGSRGNGDYYLVSDPEAREACERAWRSTSRHVIADPEELAAVGVLIRGPR